jgi:O-antigen ligase
MFTKKTVLESVVQYHLLFFIALFIIFLPLCNLFPVINLFDDQRVYQILLLCIALLDLSLSSFYISGVLSVLLKIPLQARLGLLSILILAIISALTAPLSNYAFLELSVYISIFLFSLAVAALFIQNPKLLQKAVFIFCIISCTLYQLTFFAGYLASFIENIPLAWPEPFSGFSNIRFFNQYHLWIFFLVSTPLLIYPTLSFRLRNFVKVIALGWAILLFASGSRGAILAVFLSLLICWLIFKQYAMPFIKLNLCLLSSGFIGDLFLFKLLPFLLGSDVFSGWRTVDQLTTDAPRLYLLQTSLTHIKNHPWLGIGPMHYAYYPNSIAMHPHNSLLQWAAELGLPSTIILLIIIIIGVIAWIKRYNQICIPSNDNEKQLLPIILLSTLIANLGYSLVDGVIVMPMSQILLGIISGWMFGFYFEANGQNSLSNRNIHIMLFASLTLVTLIYTVMPSFIQRINNVNKSEPMLMIPRFWQDGKIQN